MRDTGWHDRYVESDRSEPRKPWIGASLTDEIFHYLSMWWRMSGEQLATGSVIFGSMTDSKFG